MAKKVFSWIEDRLRNMDPPVPMAELARRWDLTNGSVVTHYIKLGAQYRPHLSAKWVAILADVLEWSGEVTIAHIRPAERAFQAQKGEVRDILHSTPAEVVQAAAVLLRLEYLETYRRLEETIDLILEKEVRQ